MQTYLCDVLVIGSGAAGLRAAIETTRFCKKVVVVSKGKNYTDAASFSAASPVRGMYVALNNKERQEMMKEILLAGAGKVNQSLAEILVDLSKKRFEELVEIGVRFKQGRYPGCFGSQPAAFIIDNLPLFYMNLKKWAHRCGVNFIDNTLIFKLLLKNGRFAGACGITPKNEIIFFRAKACIIATGGAAGAFKKSFAPENLTGDGYVLAYEAGAKLTGLENIQIMIGSIYPKKNFFDISVLENSQPLFPVNASTKILQQRKKHLPASFIDGSYQIDTAIADADKNGGAYIKTRNGILKLSHFAHAFNGGIIIDKNAFTGVEGIYSCGEVATGMHGIDRVGGTMITATQVFGKIAGESAGRYASKNKFSFIQTPSYKITKEPEDPVILSKEIKRILDKECLVLRDRKNLIKAIQYIKEIEEARPGTHFSYKHLQLSMLIKFANLLLPYVFGASQC